MARKAASLGPKPSSLFVFLFFLFCFFSFPFSAFNRKTRFPPRDRHFLFIFECLPLFILGLFWPPPFQFLFLCLSRVLFFLSSFLSFLFTFFWFLVFVSLFVFCLLCFCFMKETTSNYSITKFSFHQSFPIWGFLVLFSL